LELTNLYDDKIKKAVKDRIITTDQYTHLYLCQELIADCKICNKLIPYINRRMQIE